MEVSAADAAEPAEEEPDSATEILLPEEEADSAPGDMLPEDALPAPANEEQNLRLQLLRTAQDDQRGVELQRARRLQQQAG